MPGPEADREAELFGAPSQTDREAELFGAPSQTDREAGLFGAPAPDSSDDSSLPGSGAPMPTTGEFLDRLSQADETLAIGGRMYLRTDVA
ncbi:MAG: hypothetical protein QGG40_01675, partial [Myxococcota bacterium]|nr:hypothetical protein [Myxococcota bacterium]